MTLMLFYKPFLQRLLQIPQKNGVAFYSSRMTLMLFYKPFLQRLLQIPQKNGVAFHVIEAFSNQS